MPDFIIVGFADEPIPQEAANRAVEPPAIENGRTLNLTSPRRLGVRE